MENNNPESLYPPESEADAAKPIVCDHKLAFSLDELTCYCERCKWTLGTRASKSYDFTPCNVEFVQQPTRFTPEVEKQYVAGFLFSEDYAHVVLIEKNKPEWQKGKMNGVGGKIEEGETPEQAMRREFFEEAGLDIPSWQLFCKLNWRGGCIHFFRAIGDVNRAYTVTDEVIRRIPLEHLAIFKIIPNLLWLIPMAMDRHAGVATLEYLS